MKTHHKPRGRHPQHRFTAISVRATRAPGRYADGNGLYLVVDPSGAKRWIWRGLVQGKRTDLGLGGVVIVPLADARAKAVECKRIARNGDNPKQERQRARRLVPTFKEAAIQVHADHSQAFKNPKHAAQWLSSLEHDVFPIIGTQRIDTIDTGDVLKVLTPIWTTKPETARRLKQRIRLVCDWAKAKGFRTGDNPTDGMKRVLPRVRDQVEHHAALPYQDVPAFLTELRDANTIASIRLAFEFMILTATRTNEVLGATWAEIDHDAAVWTIPADRMKAHREHRIPLAPRAREILTTIAGTSRPDPTTYIFASRSATKPLSNMVFLMALRRMKRETITAHGFRSSFRDWTSERTNMPTTVCEAALAHVIKDKAEAAYHRTDLFNRRRDLMDLWAQFATGQTAKVLSVSA
jgi:integrase